MRKLVFKLFTMDIDNSNEIIKNIIMYFLFSKSDFIHFNLGPIAIVIKNGIKNGINNLL